jgi:enoyl-CoA hydratase/carnithine racemase
MDLARGITENAPLTVAACKVAIAQTRLAPERRDMARLARMVEACFQSDDYREGQAAFIAKRPPRFTGR